MKKLILFTLVLGSAMMASADLLYWMVDQTGADRQFEFAWAELTAKKGSEKYTFGEDAAIAPFVEGQPDATTGFKTAPLYTMIGTANDYSSFFVELYNSEGKLAAAPLEIMDFAQYIQKSAKDNPVAFVAQSFAVPEPTSGLLMLLGVGLLALKRKKA